MCSDHYRKRLKSLKKAIVKKVQERFKGWESNFQAKWLYNDLFDMSNDRYHIRQIVAKDLIFKNKKIDSSHYYLPDDKGTVYTINQTYRSRKFGDWNQFSIIDTRNLVKLRRGYQIEIIEGLYQNNIFKVKLLSGNSKGRKYYVITEDLLKKYIVEEQKV